MSKSILIIYPHWPPSNLAGMHRARLVANGASDLGWKVTVIAVDPAFYEEEPDEEMLQLIRPSIQTIHVSARKVTKIAGRRLIGDIGLRGYGSLQKAAETWLRQNTADFIWIPIPSWYTSLMGARLAEKFNTPFGIDYIDPWVYQLTKHEKTFSRAWWTRQLALFLEPHAIRKASIISGVSEAYFTPALERVFSKKKKPLTVSMPYGFDPTDHQVEPIHPRFPFDPNESRYILYAGAFLPHSESFARVLFTALKQLEDEGHWPKDLTFQFVGTGHRMGPSIDDLASECGVAHIVHLHPQRIPFLSVQSLLRQSFGSLILGSTEAHYTASKTFQCLVAQKPILSILHEHSSALEFLQKANATQYSTSWNNVKPAKFQSIVYHALQSFVKSHEDWSPNLSALDQHSIRVSTASLLNRIHELKQR